MTTTKPVVLYGASGYTGRLVCEYLQPPAAAIGSLNGVATPRAMAAGQR